MKNINLQKRIKRNRLKELSAEFYRDSNSKIIKRLSKENQFPLIGIENSNIYTIIGAHYVYFSTEKGEERKISHSDLLRILKKNALNIGKKGSFDFIEIDEQTLIWVLNGEVMNAIWNTILFITRSIPK